MYDKLNKDEDKSNSDDDSRAASAGGSPSPGGGGGKKDGGKKESTSPGKLQKEVERGKAPKEVDRVDKGNPIHKEQDHVHFNDGSALNKDGTWKHGTSKLSNSVKNWLNQNGWNTTKK